MHNNDLQNTPLFLILGFLYVVTDPSVGLSMAVFGAFTMARTVHTIAYWFRMSLLRSLSYIIGLCAAAYIIVSIWISCIVQN